MKTYVLAALTVIFLCVTLLTGVQAEKQVEPKALFESTCSPCHSLDWPRSKKMSKEEWASIIDRMKSNGLSISDEDSKVILEYLSKEFGK